MSDLATITASLERENNETLAATLQNTGAALQSSGARQAFEELTQILDSQEDKTIDEYKKTQERVKLLQKSIKDLQGLSRAESAALTSVISDAQSSLNQNTGFKKTIGSVIKGSVKDSISGIGGIVTGALSQSPIMAMGAGFIGERVTQFKERKAAQKAEDDERADRIATQAQTEQKEMALLRNQISNDDAIRASGKTQEQIQRDAAMMGISEQELIDQEKNAIIRRAQAEKERVDAETEARKNIEKIAERYGINVPAGDETAPTPNQDIPTSQEDSVAQEETTPRRGRGPDIAPRRARGSGIGDGDISDAGDGMSVMSGLNETQLEFQPYLEKIYEELIWQRENANNPSSLDIENSREMRRERARDRQIELDQLAAMQDQADSTGTSGGSGNEGGILDTLGDLGGLAALASGGGGILGMLGLGKDGFLTKGLKTVTGKFGRFGGKIGKLGGIVAGVAGAIGMASSLLPNFKGPAPSASSTRHPEISTADADAPRVSAADADTAEANENKRLEKERVEKLKQQQAEGEVRKAAAEKKRLQAKADALAAEKKVVADANTKRMAMDAEITSSQMQADADKELKKVQNDAKTKRMALEAEADKARNIEVADAERRQVKAEVDAETKRVELEKKAEVERFTRKNNAVELSPAKPKPVTLDIGKPKPSTTFTPDGVAKKIPTPANLTSAPKVPAGGALDAAKGAIKNATGSTVAAMADVVTPKAAKGVVAAGNMMKKKVMKNILVRKSAMFMAKMVPGLGIAAGLGFSLGRLFDGDFGGAAAEGLGVFLPSVSGAAVDVGLLAKDAYNEYYGSDENPFPLGDDIKNNPEQAYARLGEITTMAKDVILGAEENVQAHNKEEYAKQTAELEGKIAADQEIADTGNMRGPGALATRQAKMRVRQNTRKLEELKKNNPADTMPPIPAQSPDRGDAEMENISTQEDAGMTEMSDSTAAAENPYQAERMKYDKDGDGKLNNYERKMYKIGQAEKRLRVANNNDVSSADQSAKLAVQDKMNSAAVAKSDAAGAGTNNVVVAPTNTQSTVVNNSAPVLGKVGINTRNQDVSAQRFASSLGSF